MKSQNMTSLRHQFAGWEQAQEYYLEANLTDGLPIVPPSEDRVGAMLEFAGLPPDQVIGVEAIRQKHITAEKVAINAVMAGCRPEYFPVVVSAVAACCERDFNLHASSTSTNGITVLVLQHGDGDRGKFTSSGKHLRWQGSRFISYRRRSRHDWTGSVHLGGAGGSKSRGDAIRGRGRLVPAASARVSLGKGPVTCPGMDRLAARGTS